MLVRYLSIHQKTRYARSVMIRNQMMKIPPEGGTCVPFRGQLDLSGHGRPLTVPS